MKALIQPKERHSLPNPPSLPLHNENLEEKVKDNLNLFINTITNFDKTYAEIAEPDHDKQEVLKVFFRLIYTLKTLQLHFNFLLNVLTSQEEEQILKLKEESKKIADLYEKVKHRSDINLLTTYQALETVLNTSFKDLEAITNNFFIAQNGVRKVKKNEETISHVRIITSKLESIIEYFPYFTTLSQEDLFARNRSSTVWDNLYADVQFKNFIDKKEINSSLGMFFSMLIVANAVMYRIGEVKDKTDSETLSKVLGILSGGYYLTQKQKAKTRADLFYAQNNSMDTAFKVWNMLDKKWVKGLYKFFRLPSIGYDQKIFVPRLFKKITKESILKEYEEGTINSINMGTFSAPDLSGQKEEILNTLFTENSERVQIRIIAPWPLTIKGKAMEKVRVAVNEIKNKLKYTSKFRFKDNFNGVVIHIHGGGFVAMSSASHRNYLYRWAKSLNMIIFSIDYRLAPANPYPAPLDDVWQGYNWIINYSESILGIPMDKIVLTGDSAGGNLAMALTLRAIKEGVRVPDGCLLSYPALNLFPQKVVPSYFVALEDVMLPYSFLKLCIKAYVPEEFNPAADPFLSPIVASNELLAKMPPVRIITGTGDPLHDDTWKLLHKLQNLKKNVQMTVYEGMPHGFLSLEEIAAYELIIAESVGRMRELFYFGEANNVQNENERNNITV